MLTYFSYAKQHMQHSPVMCIDCHWRPVSQTASQLQLPAESLLAQPSQQADQVSKHIYKTTQDL